MSHKHLEYQREASRRWYAKKKQEYEWQRAVEAGEISDAELDARRQEQREKDEAEKARLEKRTVERREYAREWAQKRRARLKAEREAQAQCTKISWQFTTKDARIKLKRLYPTSL